MPADTRHDVVIVGGGHNGLVAAAYLARAGRDVLLLERREHLGGAAVSERPWPGVDARLSRYAYLVSLLPPRIVSDLGLDITLRRRAEPPRPQDDGARRLRAVTRTVARAVWPTLLHPLPTRARLREQVADDAAWEAVFERPIGELLEDCLPDDAARGAALTDALIGTFAGAHDADLRQNRCFLYHVIGQGTGEWDVPVGGMGRVTDELARAARQAGATLRTSAEVTAVEPGAVRHASGVARARHIVVNAAPAVLDALRGRPNATPRPEGSQLKLNVLLARLPRLRDPALDPARALAGTFHVNEGYAQLDAAHREASSGRIPDVVPCETYCHSLTDPSILGPELRAAGAHTLTCFALHLPARLFAADHDAAKRAAVERTLASLDSALAEPLVDCAWRDAEGRPCVEARTPQELEAELALPGGHIFHRDLQWPFADDEAKVGTWGVETDEPGILLCGAGARRGGGVSGVPGHNAAMAVLRSR